MKQSYFTLAFLQDLSVRHCVTQCMPEGKLEPFHLRNLPCHSFSLSTVYLENVCFWPCSKASNPMIHLGFTLWGSVLSSNGKQAVPIKTYLKERKFHIFLLVDRSLINFGVKKFLYSSGTAHISYKPDV